MAHADQFAKRSYADEASAQTGGALSFRDPPEVSVSHIHGDGAFQVQRRAALRVLPAPWPEAAAQREILLELKLGADHVDALEVERAVLRRQMRQVRRMEQARAGGRRVPDQDALWIVAPHLPGWLRKRRRVRMIAPGCYRVGPAWFRLLWLAANDLPLREDLVPFLLSRTGRRLDQFAVWVATRRSIEWVLEMLHCLKVSPKVREDLQRRFARSDDPEVAAKQRETLVWLLSLFPEEKDRVLEEGKLSEARVAVRKVLARRGLKLSRRDEAKIDGCTDLATLDRWLDQAVTAATVKRAMR